MPNPFDSVRVGGGSAPAATVEAPKANPFDAVHVQRAAPSTPSNPFAPALNAVGSAASAIGTPITKALDAQRWAVARALTGRANTDNQMTAERKALGTEGVYQAMGHIPVVGHALQGASDVVQQTLTDPLTYETLGFGPVLKALGIAGKVGPAAMKAINATAPGRLLYDAFHWGGPVARERGTETVQTIRGAASLAESQGSRVQQRLVQRFHTITKGLSDEEKVKVGQALNGELAHEVEGTLTPKERSAYRQLRTLTEMDYKLRSNVVRSILFNQLTKDLPESERATLARMLRRNKPIEIPEPMKRHKVEQPGLSVNQKTRLGNAHRPVQGPRRPGEPVPPQIAEPVDIGPGAYKMPRLNESAIQKAERLNAIYHDLQFRVEKAMPRREDYMPWAHYATEPEEGRAAAQVNKLDHFDPRNLERPDLKVTHPSHLTSGFEAMAKNTGRQVQRGVLHDALGELVSDPKVSKLFEDTIKATGEQRTDPEKLKDLWLSFVGYPRAATVSFTPRHAVNILDLLANTVGPEKAPAVLKETMALAAKLANPKITAKEYDALTKAGRDLGALSGSFREREAFFQHVPSARVGELPFGKYAPKAVQGKPVFGPLAGKSTGALGAYTALNNRLVWAVDDAAKTVYAKLLHDSGEATGLRAGALASGRLVDYAHLPPFAKALRYVAPFGSFRGSIPGAVVGGIARNPARAALLSRATGGAFYGSQPGYGEHGWRFQGPTAEVGRMFSETPGFGYTEKQRETNTRSGLGTYARSTMGDLPKGILSGLQDVLAPNEHPARWATYGQSWLPKYDKKGKLDMGFLIDSALAGVPQAQTMLDALGVGRFQWRGMAPEALRQVLGVEVK